MNTSGVPGTLVLAERQLGFDSRLVTLFRDRRRYFEDICLDLPFIDFGGTRWIKRRVSSPERLRVDNRLRIPDKIPPTWQPHSLAEKWLIRWRDRLWWPRIQRAVRRFQLDAFDVYQLDGGLDFTRIPRFIPAMKHSGRRIICCYTGSDLRTRGVIAEIDRISDLNITVEFDHLKLHPDIHHVFFPFDVGKFVYNPPTVKTGGLRVGHAPTSWAAKGSDIIIRTLKRLSRTHGIEMVLIQKLSYNKAIALKSTCDLFIDQIGDLGYGINALEALAMGIPTCSCLAADFNRVYPDHPFIEVQAENLEHELIRLLKAPRRRQDLSRAGRLWVERRHDAVKTTQRIHQLLLERGG